MNHYIIILNILLQLCAGATGLSGGIVVASSWYGDFAIMRRWLFVFIPLLIITIIFTLYHP